MGPHLYLFPSQMVRVLKVPHRLVDHTEEGYVVTFEKSRGARFKNCLFPCGQYVLAVLLAGGFALRFNFRGPANGFGKWSVCPSGADNVEEVCIVPFLRRPGGETWSSRRPVSPSLGCARL